MLLPPEFTTQRLPLESTASPRGRAIGGLVAARVNDARTIGQSRAAARAMLRMIFMAISPEGARLQMWLTSKSDVSEAIPSGDQEFFSDAGRHFCQRHYLRHY